MINASSDCRRVRTFVLMRMPAYQHNKRDARIFLVGVRNKPAETRAVIRARTSFSERLLAFMVVAGLRRAVQNSGLHTFANIRNIRPYIKLMFYARREITNCIFTAWVLQVIHRAAIRQRRNK